MHSFFSKIGQKKNFLWTKKFFFELFTLIYCFDNFFRIWNSNFFRLKTKRYLGHQGTILKLCGSKKCSNLISCSTDNYIKFWDLLSSRSLRTIQIKFDLVQCVELNSSKQVLICLGKETLTLWDMYRGFCFASVYIFPNFRPSLTFFKKSDIFCLPQKDNSLVFLDLKSGSILKKTYLKKNFLFLEWVSKLKVLYFFEKLVFYIDFEKFRNNQKIMALPWFFKENHFRQTIILNKWKYKKFPIKKIFGFSGRGDFVKILDIKTSLFLWPI